MKQKRRANGPQIQEITSRQNARFKDWLSLLEGRAVKKSGRALVSGSKLVREFLTTRADDAQEILLPLKEDLESPGVPSFRLPSALFRELDILGTDAPLLVVKTPAVETWAPESPRGLELIAALSDPGNLGALLRSAEAFGAARVILCEESCSPFLPKVTRAASLANFRLRLARGPTLRALELKSGYGLDMEGEDIRALNWPRDLHLVLGEEGRGLPETLVLKRVKIPMNGSVESLNATAAASIALFSYMNSLVK